MSRFVPFVLVGGVDHLIKTTVGRCEGVVDSTDQDKGLWD